MLESLMVFIKTLPTWLGAVAEILLVAIIFMTAVTFLAGVWVGLHIIGMRMRNIRELQFVPPKIVFESFDKKDQEDK
jgi:hypothetical protein